MFSRISRKSYINTNRNLRNQSITLISNLTSTENFDYKLLYYYYYYCRYRAVANQKSVLHTKILRKKRSCAFHVNILINIMDSKDNLNT